MYRYIFICIFPFFVCPPHNSSTPLLGFTLLLVSLFSQGAGVLPGPV